MGILNVTPDSFSDGGKYRDVSEAVDAAIQMTEDGAAIIDVGGESTRPGSSPVPLETEMSRVLPVVEALVAKGITVSVDTSKSEVAETALGLGAHMINDVSALQDPRMTEVCAKAECRVCLMHMKGTPLTMQLAPEYGNVVQEVEAFLLSRALYAMKVGISRDKIIFDPGIGFGKTDGHNLDLIRQIDVLVDTGFPVLLGVSRKGFLGRVLATDGISAPVENREAAALAIQTFAQLKGVEIFRTHDVVGAVQTSKMLDAVLQSKTL